MLIDVSWAGSRTRAVPVLRPGRPLLADNVRRSQHPNTAADTGAMCITHQPACSHRLADKPLGLAKVWNQMVTETHWCWSLQSWRKKRFFFFGTEFAHFRPSEGEIWEGKQPFSHPALQWQKYGFWVTRDFLVQSLWWVQKPPPAAPFASVVLPGVWNRGRTAQIINLSGMEQEQIE